MSDVKLAVLFPGIGYTCDKPLLYYAARLAREKGYQVRPLPYGPFPAKVRGDAELMRRCFDIAWIQAEAMLKDVVWEDCEDILFIGKSIGTTVAARYAREHGLSARCALLTPLEETFLFTRGDAVAFHGTGDPWADTAALRTACAAQGIPLHLTPDANHSLETGALEADLRTLEETIRILSAFIDGA